MGGGRREEVVAVGVAGAAVGGGRIERESGRSGRERGEREGEEGQGIEGPVEPRPEQNRLLLSQV